MWHIEEFLWEFLVVSIMLGLMVALGWLVDLAAKLSDEKEVQVIKYIHLGGFSVYYVIIMFRGIVRLFKGRPQSR